MSHQSQLENPKYRNWVKGVLAYKYLKEGIEGFVEVFFQEEHTKILGVVNNTSGNTCTQCSIQSLRKEVKCPNNICNVIFEEIKKSHVYEAPNWKNIDVQKLYTNPWDIAKCFINAPGYSNKTKAADIDASGLLHLFINNKNLHAHLSCNKTGKNIFVKCREGRNTLFHSPDEELEDDQLTECIDDIIQILEDPRKLALLVDAQTAVKKLKQLKQQKLTISTDIEAEVFGDALAFITNKTVELNEKIQEANDDIYNKHVDTSYREDALNKIRDIDLIIQNVESLIKRINKPEVNSQIKETHFQRLLEQNKIIDEIKDKTRKLQFLVDKKALQYGLMSLYESSYVKTSRSPLKLQENDIIFDEVYVSPKMVVEGDENSRCETGEKKDRPINEYFDLFQSNGKCNKAIYIVGDVGSGKSSFCKMMINDWCEAIHEKSNKSVASHVISETSEMSDDSNTADRNIEGLEKFDFLFFFSFKRMEGFNNITEMIKAVVKASGLATSNDLIDRIFEQDSERCLIVADGLDEWTPPNTPSVLEHVNNGLAERGQAQSATIVTFSRPSAKGILYLASSECDLRVKLMGIYEKDIPKLIANYLSKFKNDNKSLGEFMQKIKSLNLEHLENSPLLLQQLVWLYCNGKEIGKSRCDVYCNIVNCMLSWSDNKEENLENDFSQTVKQRQLPKTLRKFESFIKKKRYVLILGQVAFESLTTEEGSSTFRRSNFWEYNFSEPDINKLIKLGILVEENCYDPTQAKTQLSFIHTSYLEFFAAVYASCRFDEKLLDENTSVLTELFPKVKTAADILKLSNLIKMICGLCPFAFSGVSRFVSNSLKMDEKLLSLTKIYDIAFSQSLDRIQEVIFSCFSECDTNDKPLVYLANVNIGRFTDMSALRSIVLENVISLHARDRSDEEFYTWITQLKNLQYLHIRCHEIPHVQVPLFSSFIEETPLISLLLDEVGCQKHDCTGHSIDLSRQNKLQDLTFIECHNITIYHINQDLKIVHLEMTPTLDICPLRNARSLIDLTLGTCTVSNSYLNVNNQANEVIHMLHQIQTLTITKADISENSLTVKLEMRNLKHINLNNVKMCLKTWRTFVDSLLTLQQVVCVNTFYGFLFDSDNQNLINKKTYVEEKEKEKLVEITEDWTEDDETTHLRFETLSNDIDLK